MQKLIQSLLILQKCHKDFTLNGNTFSFEKTLLDASKSVNVAIFTFLESWFDERDYIIVKTSGSTGKPKEIQLKKQHMVNSAVATGAYFNLPSKTKTLLCLSANYIAGKMMLVRALVLGWQLDVVDTGSNPLQTVEQEYDFCAMVPLQLYNSLDKISKIKKLIVGGGVVSKDLEEKLQDIKTEVFATYGMTETITHIAVKKLNNWSLRGGTTWQSVKNNEITSPQTPRNDVQRHAELVSASHHYTVLPNIKISKDKRGCLIIDAPKVSDALVITNDLVEIVSKTEFKWLGRYDTIINSGGIKLIPEQIEEKLSAVIDSRFFVAGIPDKVFGEKLILVIERDVASSDSDDNQNCIEKSIISNEERNLIKSSINDLISLSKYEKPKEIYFLPKFIETDTKKIQRQKTLDLIL